MRRRTMLGLYLILPIAGGGACSAAGPDGAAMLEGAKAVDARFVAAYNAGNADSIAVLYADSGAAAIFPDGVVVTNRDAIRAQFAAALASMPGVRFEVLEQQFSVADKSVMSWGRFRLTIPTAAGTPQVLDGHFSDAKVFRNGEWKYLVDHGAFPPPPPPTAPVPTPAKD